MPYQRASGSSRKTDGQVVATRDYAEMIERRHLWSYGGHVLPLIRDNHGKAQPGCIFNATDEPRYRVRLCNMFAVSNGAKIAEQPFIDYPNAAAVVADGWAVD